MLNNLSVFAVVFFQFKSLSFISTFPPPHVWSNSHRFILSPIYACMVVILIFYFHGLSKQTSIECCNTYTERIHNKSGCAQLVSLSIAVTTIFLSFFKIVSEFSIRFSGLFAPFFRDLKKENEIQCYFEWLLNLNFCCLDAALDSLHDKSN